MDRPSKDLYLPKLFGGPRHGRRHAVDPRASYRIDFPSLSTMPHFCYPDDAPKPFVLEPLKTHVYTQRKAVIGDNMLRYYAISTANDKRAFEMLCNHMLRGAVEV